MTDALDDEELVCSCGNTGRTQSNVDGADVETFCGMCEIGARAEDDYLDRNGLERINGTKRLTRVAS